MRASLISACLMTACILAAVGPVAAADLGEGYAEPPYDDNGDYGYGDERDPPQPRYGDRYGEAPPPDRYQEPYDDDAEPPHGSIKDGYPVPVPPPRASAPPPRYADRPPPRAERYACLEPRQIRRRLRGEGWLGIRPMGGDGVIVHLRAGRYDSSSVFHLRVDRCSGEVIAARPRARHFAYRDWRRDRRW